MFKRKWTLPPFVGKTYLSVSSSIHRIKYACFINVITFILFKQNLLYYILHVILCKKRWFLGKQRWWWIFVDICIILKNIIQYWFVLLSVSCLTVVLCLARWYNSHMETLAFPMNGWDVRYMLDISDFWTVKSHWG